MRATPYAEPVSELTIVDLTAPDDRPELVEETYRAVLRPSFNTDELSGVEAVRPHPGRLLSVALDAAGVPVAAAVTELEPGGISLLGYLAASPAARGLGAGGRLMAHLVEFWTAGDYPLVLAEVHDPRGHAEAEDEHPEARLRFYGRAGAAVLDVPWVQPALSADGARVPDMLLLALHDSGPVDSAALVAWARDYFTGAEGAGFEDAQAAALLARMAQREQIPVLPLEHWRQVEPLARD